MFAHSLHISIFEVRNSVHNTENFLRLNNNALCACGCIFLSDLLSFAAPHNQGVFSLLNVFKIHKMRNLKQNVLNANNSSIVDNSEILTYEFAETLKMLSLCIEDKASATMQCLNNKKELEKNLSQIVALSRSINRAIDPEEFQDLGDILKTLSNHYQNQI